MIEYWKDALYLLGILAAFITGNKSKKIDDLSKYQTMYDTFVSQYEKQYKLLETKVDSLQNSVADLNLRNAIIYEESQSWKKKFEGLQKLYNKLKAEFENYKIDHK